MDSSPNPCFCWVPEPRSDTVPSVWGPLPPGSMTWVQKSRQIRCESRNPRGSRQGQPGVKLQPLHCRPQAEAEGCLRPPAGQGMPVSSSSSPARGWGADRPKCREEEERARVNEAGSSPSHPHSPNLRGCSTTHAASSGKGSMVH